MSKYFEPVPYKQYEVFQIDASSTSIISVYEGVASTDTTTLLGRPIKETVVRNYHNFSPLTGSVNNALEIQVKHSTWTVNTGDNIDRFQPFLNNR